MPAAKPKINPLDPFGDNEDDYKTKEIRRSRARQGNNFFTNFIHPNDKQSRTHLIIACIASLLIIIISITLLVILPRQESVDPTISDNPLVNPTGREATSEFTKDLNDPEIRQKEQKKLNTAALLVSSEDWENANASFETIFPDYLDACGRYEYYRIAVILADNFEGFSIDRDTAETRRNYLIEKCDNAEAD